MKKRGISIAALAIACVFAATAIAFAACVYSDYNSGLKAAGAKFEKLSSRTAEASEMYSSGSKAFITLFNSAVGSPEIFESITLKVNGQEVYVYPTEEARSPSVFVRSFSTRIVGGDGADIRLDANIYTVSSALIYWRAKIAFIIVLAGTLLACVLLLSLYLGESPRSREESGESNKGHIFGEPLLDQEDDGAPEGEEPLSDGDKKEAEESAPEIPPAQDEEAAQEAEEKLDYNPLENAYADQKAEEAAGGGQEEIPEPQEADEAPKAEAGGTESAQTEEESAEERPSAPPEQGLFSPASGFGWESYLETRLESELVRAASSEQDLSLALIQIPGMAKEAPYYKDICGVLENFFQFKDFIFERGEDGFAAIIQNSDVDKAMQSAELLHAELTGALNSAGQGAKPLIGISSRSLRLISAGRLKNEAEQALVHAAEDPSSPIIAFRVNPEKYRKYISGKEEA